MASSYLIPTITSLSPGYQCTVPVPWGNLAKRLVSGHGRVIWYARVVHEGKVEAETVRVVEFQEGELAGSAPVPLMWNDASGQWGGVPGYLEMGFNSESGGPIFYDKQVLAFYAIYTAPGKKSFFSDNAYKYASPPVISQIAQYGQFLDGYPVVHLDRDHDLGATLMLINPYSKAVVAKVVTYDGRSLERLRVAPMSARCVSLVDLLRKEERVWHGQIQLTANNRLVTFVTLHSLADPQVISDQEHLDPYRGDPTHMPAFQWFRQKVGRVLANHGVRLRDY